MVKIITPKQQLELFEWDVLVEKLRSFDKDPFQSLTITFVLSISAENWRKLLRGQEKAQGGHLMMW